MKRFQRISKIFFFDLTNIGSVKTSTYGESIQQEVIDFYNLFSPNDNYLEPKAFMQIYPSYEFGDWHLDKVAIKLFHIQYHFHCLETMFK